MKKLTSPWTDEQWLAWVVEQLAEARRDDDWVLIRDVETVLKQVLPGERAGT